LHFVIINGCITHSVQFEWPGTSAKNITVWISWFGQD
jgi:hypothetical protein